MRYLKILYFSKPNRYCIGKIKWVSVKPPIIIGLTFYLFRAVEQLNRITALSHKLHIAFYGCQCEKEEWFINRDSFALYLVLIQNEPRFQWWRRWIDFVHLKQQKNEKFLRSAVIYFVCHFLLNILDGCFQPYVSPWLEPIQRQVTWCSWTLFQLTTSATAMPIIAQLGSCQARPILQLPRVCVCTLMLHLLESSS